MYSIYICMHIYIHALCTCMCAWLYKHILYIYIYIMVLSTQQNPGFFRKFTWPRLGDDVDHPCLLHGRYLGKDLETSADTGHGWWGKNFMTWLCPQKMEEILVKRWCKKSNKARSFRSKKVKGWGYYPWFALICGFLFSKNWFTAVQNEKICKTIICMYWYIYIYIIHFFYISYMYIYIYILYHIYMC